VVLRGTAAGVDPEIVGLVDASGRGCEVEGPDGVGGGEMKATFFCVSELAAVSAALRAAVLEGGSEGSAVWGTGEETGRPTPLSLSASCGSSMGGRGRAERSGRGLEEAMEDGVPVVVVPALADLCIWAGEGGHSGSGGSWRSAFFSRAGECEFELVDELVSLRLSLSLSVSFSLSLSLFLSFGSLDRPRLSLLRNAFMVEEKRTCSARRAHFRRESLTRQQLIKTKHTCARTRDKTSATTYSRPDSLAPTIYSRAMELGSGVRMSTTASC
jgi:hypothetical protein